MATTEIKLCDKKIKYITQKEAVALEGELYNDFNCSVDQMMELSGLSVATAINHTFTPSTHQRVLIVCGPGSNGSNGLVAARHMSLFGYKVSIHYPIRKSINLYERLFSQALRYGVDLAERIRSIKNLQNQYDLLVDALLGIHMNPPVKPALQPALEVLIKGELPVCSVDIPSGWHVDNGPNASLALKPALLVSLSAPKLCSKPEFLKGTRHFLGGRFLPPSIIKNYNLIMPPFPEHDQVVEIFDAD